MTAFTHTPSGGITLEAFADPPNTGTLAVTTPIVTAAIAVHNGNVVIGTTLPIVTGLLYPLLVEGTGVIGTNLTKLTASIDGYVNTGAFGVTLPKLTGHIDSYTGLPKTLTIASTLPKMVGTLYSPNAYSASIDIQTPRLQGEITVLATNICSFVGTLPDVITSVDANSGNAGDVAARVTAPSGSLNVVATNVGTFSGKVPAIYGVAYGAQAITATMSGSIPLPRTVFNTSQVVTHTLVMVTNLVTKAISNYEQYNYNSYAEMGGKYYAAGPDGLFMIDSGDTDNTAPISAKMKFGNKDLGSDKQKRITDFYASMHSDGDITLRAYVDEADALEYTIGTHNVASLEQRRVAIGKGARGIYWQFELENTDGCYFDVSALNIAVVPTARRI